MPARRKTPGIAGVTTVIVREELLAKGGKNLPAILDYRLYAENDSMYNTPPTFAIYILMLVARWLKNDIGGLEKMAQLNRQKSQLLYSVLDASGGFYRGHALADCRSAMNVTFRLPSEELERQIPQRSQEPQAGRSERAPLGRRHPRSIYNAMPLAGVEALRDFMVDFRKKNA